MTDKFSLICRIYRVLLGSHCFFFDYITETVSLYEAVGYGGCQLSFCGTVVLSNLRFN